MSNHCNYMRNLVTSVSKTAFLTAVLGAGSIGCGSSQPPPVPASPQIPSAEPQAERLVVPTRAGVFTEATEHYGPLVVRESDEYARSDTRPWSAYWYPLSDDLLVASSSRNGGQSTLDKYDKYSDRIFSVKSTSIAEEVTKGMFNVRAEKWEGRCGAWAIASVLEPEPSLPEAGVSLPGVDFKFFTRDVKALVIKSYERVDNSAFRRFGQPYTGDDGQEFQDLYPDQFHRVMQAELFEKHRPFLMDDDPSTQVWNTPVWQAQTTISREPNDPHVMHVFTRIRGAQSIRISPDYAGPSKDTTYQYTYDLFGDPQEDGTFAVKFGQWTESSIKDHPDFLLTLPDKDVKVRHLSQNEQIDSKVVEDILLKTGARH